MPVAPFDARDEALRAIDAPVESPPLAAAAATRSAEGGLRLIAGAASLALAAHAHGGTALALVGLAMASLAGVAPRFTAIATALAGVTVASGRWGTAAAVLLAGVCALWLRLQRGSSGAWLGAVRRLERQRARALVAAGLARSQRSELGEAALARAGDHYEREGAARRRLAELGATPVRWLGPVLGCAEQLGRALPDRVRDALERAASEADRN